jgi:hypothetical protein
MMLLLADVKSESLQDQPSAGLFARSSQSDGNAVKVNAPVGRRLVLERLLYTFLYCCRTWTSKLKDLVTGFQIFTVSGRNMVEESFSLSEGTIFHDRCWKVKDSYGNDLPLQLRTCCTFGNGLN